jgi:hypothetical protein
MLKRTDFAEKRQFGRRAANLHAWIRVGGRPPQPCTLSNISDGGALITLIDSTWVPFSFRLTSEDKTVDFVCEVRHQGGPRVGVEFVAPGHAFQAMRAANEAAPAANSWSARSIRT